VSTFDKQEYQDRQYRAASEVEEVLRQRVALDEWGRGPVVEFTCPKQHSLKRYRAEEDPSGDIRLVALPGVAAKAGPVASNGSVFRLRGVCDVPGCPKLQPCPEHPQQSERVDDIRTTFTCRTCAWSSAFTRPRLLKVYTAAVVLGMRSVPVTFSERSTRR
jgi:hypothetical protein